MVLHPEVSDPDKFLCFTTVVVQWLSLLLHIKEDPGSNLNPDAGHPDKFSWFSSVAAITPAVIWED
jgi:hypothetical protein